MSTGNKELDHNVKTFKKYRNLLKELTAKNVKLKYRNSWLGILWSFISCIRRYLRKVKQARNLLPCLSFHRSTFIQLLYFVNKAGYDLV
jgi:hypothetical protein